MMRTMFVGATALALLASGAARAHQGSDTLIDKKDQLTEKDPGYKPDLTKLSAKVKAVPQGDKFMAFIEGNPHKVYKLKLKKGDKIVIEMKSVKPENIDSVVIVEDSKKNVLDFNDDNPDGMTLDSKLVWTAPEDGEYSVIATVLHAQVQNKYGEYHLTVTKAK